MYIQAALPFLAVDRLESLLNPGTLPAESMGTALFADLAGFTAMTRRLVEEAGARRGAELATQQLNVVLDQIVAPVHAWGGSVLSFSGDGFLCWFPGEATGGAEAAAYAAVACGFAMQAAIVQQMPQHETSVSLALKVGLASGRIQRFVVGDPAVQLLEAMTGDPVTAAVAAEGCARAGEVVGDLATQLLVGNLVQVVEWRQADDGETRYGVLAGQSIAASAPQPARVEVLHRMALECLAVQDVRPWLLPAVSEQLLAGQPAFLAELRPAIAVFARFADAQPGADAQTQAALAEYVAWAQRIFAQVGGAVIQLTLGDKGSYLYGVVGVPQQQQDTPMQAVHVARQLAQGPDTGKLPAQVGMAQGRMRTGAYGGQQRRTFGVQGNAVNLAARLMMAAKPGDILMDAAVATLVDASYAMARVEPAYLHGLSAQVRVFRLGIRRSATGSESHFAGMQLVERTEALARLEAALRQAQAGPRQVVVITGEAGEGKSALLWQFAQRAEARVIACSGSMSDLGYGLVLELILRLLEIPVDSTQPADWHVVEAGLRAAGVVGAAPLTVLAEVMGQARGSESLALDIEQRRQILASLLIYLCRRRDDARPRLILLDDYHAADPAARAVLAHVFQADEPMHTLFVVAQRAEPGDGTWAVPHGPVVDVWPLGGLTSQESTQLLGARLHGELDPLAADLLARYSQGNPLFLTTLAEELVAQGRLLNRERQWHMAEDIFGRLQAAGALRRQDGVWRLSPDHGLSAADLGLPDTLHRIVLEKLDRMPASARFTLKVVAAADAGLSESLLVKAHPNADGAAIGHDLETLVARGFVRLAAHAAEARYGMANSVIHDVVYESLLDAQRVALHLALAEAYATLAPSQAEAIAYHYFRSDLQDGAILRRAQSALVEAVDAARRRFAFERALGFVDCLLQLEPVWRWYRTKFELLHGLGLRAEQATLLEQMVHVADRSALEFAFCHARFAEVMADYPTAQSWTEQAAAQAEAAGNVVEHVEALCLLGQIARRKGDHAEAEQIYRAALTRVSTTEGDVNGKQRGDIMYGLGVAARHQSDYAGARRWFGDALAAYVQAGARSQEALTLTALGVLAQIERNYASANEYHTQALAARRAINDWPGEGASLASLAQLRRAQGFHAEAIGYLRAAQSIQQSLRDRWWENRILNEIGVVYLIAGMPAEARPALEQGIRLAQSIGDAAGEMVLLLNLGQVLRDGGDLEGALETLARSLAMAEAQGEKYVAAQCHSDLARTYLWLGRYAEATHAASRARQALEALGLDAAITADLATLTEACLARGDVPAAAELARKIVAVLDGSSGEGADFPQRDYWVAYEALAQAGEGALAKHALAQSIHHLQTMADRFQDEEMRRSFLQNLPVNRAIAEKASISGSAYPESSTL